MFVITRIANGVVVLLAFFMAFLLLPALPSPTATIMVVAFGSVTLLYVSDLLFRRKDTKSDAVFAALWTLIFLYAVYRAALTLTAGVPEEMAEDPTILYGTFITFYLIPLLLNGSYLWRSLAQKRAAT